MNNNSKETSNGALVEGVGSVPVGRKIIGLGKPEKVTFSAAKPVRDQVREDTARLGFPDHLQRVEDAEGAVGKLQVLAGAQPPQDKDRFLSDRLAEEHLDALREVATSKEARSASSEEEHHAAKMELAGVHAPVPWYSVLWRILLTAVVTVVVIAGAGLLLAPTISDLNYGAIAEGIYGEDADAQRFAVAFLVGLSFAGLVVLPQFVAVIATSGRIGWAKPLFLLADLGFAAAVGGLRLHESFEFAPLFWTVIELAGLLGQTALYFALARYLRERQDAKHVHAPLKRRVRVLRDLSRRLDKTVIETQSLISDQVQAFADRDMTAYQAEVYADLAEQTARLTYLIEAGHHISNAASGAPDERLERQVTALLEGVGKELTISPRTMTRKVVRKR